MPEGTSQKPTELGGAEPEDIFARSDVANSRPDIGTSEKPEVQGVESYTQENSFSDPKVEATQNYSSSPIKKFVVVIIVIAAATAIGFGAFWYYNKLLSGSMQQVLNENVNKNAAIESDSSKNISDKSSEGLSSENKLPDSQPLTKPEIQPISLDTDNDGLTDKDETRYGTDPQKSDSDGDGLTDREELLTFKTNPQVADTDGDTYSDSQEIKNGYNPLGSGKLGSQQSN